jgi:hypothetical protein
MLTYYMERILCWLSFYFKINYDSFSFIRFLMNFLYDLFKQIWLRSYGFWGKREYFFKRANTKTYSNSILLTVFIGSKNDVMDLLSESPIFALCVLWFGNCRSPKISKINTNLYFVPIIFFLIHKEMLTRTKVYCWKPLCLQRKMKTTDP